MVWKTPYRLDISGVLEPGSSNLKIRVANTWANRIALEIASLAPPRNMLLLLRRSIARTRRYGRRGCWARCRLCAQKQSKNGWVFEGGISSTPEFLIASIDRSGFLLVYPREASRPAVPLRLYSQSHPFPGRWLRSRQFSQSSLDLHTS